MHSFPLIFLWFIYQNVSQGLGLWNNTRRYEILHTESCAIINDLDVILLGFMLQIVYTTIFLSWPVKPWYKYYLSCTCSVWAVELHWLDIFLLYYIYCNWHFCYIVYTVTDWYIFVIYTVTDRYIILYILPLTDIFFVYYI